MIKSLEETAAGEVHFVKPVWFGLIRKRKRRDEVIVADYLSSKETELKLPAVANETGEHIEVALVDADATDQFVFFLAKGVNSSSFHLFAYELRTGAFFRINHQNDHWDPVALQPVSSSARHFDLTLQFAYLDFLRTYQEVISKNQPVQMACTSFAAFLVTNFEHESILKKIHDSRTPSPSAGPSSMPLLYNLPFCIQKIAAGRDHLALLEADQGHVWMLGTGTRGELGNGHLDSGNWLKGPSRIDSLAEARIRCMDVHCGGWHTVVLTDQGDLYGWGWNSHSQLGSSPDQITIQPKPFPFDLGDERAISVHCMANNTFITSSDRSDHSFGEFSLEFNAKEMNGKEQPGQENNKVIKNAHEPETQTNSGDSEQREHEQQEEKYEKEGTSSNSRGEPVEKRQRQQRMLNLAIAGCSHGQMDTIYERLLQVERQRGIKLDLLICCGDFQAIRNHGDLHHLNTPPHHRKLGTFYKYYNGEKLAPVLTLIIGGNHESSGYMAELPNGGWLAPNIFYMGFASVVNFCGLRIAGLSGIFKPGDYNRGHFERPPFRERGSLISAYHVRSVDVFRLRQLRDSPLDIAFSHDWPSGIADFGDRDTLLRIKPHFTEDVINNRLGNPATMSLIHELKPTHWFAAHMHVHFTATVPHSDVSRTQFLALDKPNDNPRRRFLEFLQFPVEEDAPLDLSYDPHWLAILQATDELTLFTDKNVYMPDDNSHNFRPTPSQIESVKTLFGGDLRIPLNFQQTAPPETEPWKAKGRQASLYYRNPQSQQFCERLGIRDLNLLFAQASADFLGIPHFLSIKAPEIEGNDAGKVSANPDEIDLDNDEFNGDDFVVDVPVVEN